MLRVMDTQPWLAYCRELLDRAPRGRGGPEECAFELDAWRTEIVRSRVLPLFSAPLGRVRSLLALTTIVCAATFANAQDVKPEKEPTLAEAKAAFAKEDRSLNQAWSAAKAAAAKLGAVEELTQKQRAWLEYRDYQAGHESSALGEKEPKRSAVWHTTAAGLTQSRVEWLRGWAESTKAPHETLTGVWIDSYGGDMRVVHQPAAATTAFGESGVARLLFAIDVVRGPTYHTGGVAGVASWNQRIGWWSDKGLDPEKTDESNLAFVDRDRCLEVVGANTSHYHGARAYFDGIYVKVEPLDEKAQAEVIKAAESGQPLVDDEGGE